MSKHPSTGIIMSGCMRSVKCVPRARALAWTTSPPLEIGIGMRGPGLLQSKSLIRSNSILTPRAGLRWSSSNCRTTDFQGKKVAAGVGKSKVKGWTGFSVLALMAASAVGAGLIVGWKSEGRKDREREYSNAAKFVRPAYANLSDMESVSFKSHCCIAISKCFESLCLDQGWTRF